MKQSKYNTRVNIDDKKSVIYNTLSRKYLAYSNSKEKYINELLDNLNEQRYSVEDGLVLKKMIQKGLIVQKDLDETSKLELLYDKAKYKENTFYLIIQPTLNCNFRCVYCYQEHRKDRLNNIDAEKIIKFVENKCKDVKKLKVGWFGGEPMLEIDTICRLTEKFKKICEENNCKYEATITSNGYLFSDENIELLDNLSIKNVQITIDGMNDYHDKKRPLINGQGSFQRIRDNIIKLLETGINIVLRINVNEENYSNICEVFDIIPENYRHKVIINISNIFQNKTQLNCYHLYRTSIDKGYTYYDKVNNLIKCEACALNSVTIDPNCNVTFCAVLSEKQHYYGTINENGNINLKDQAFYFKFNNTSAFDSEMCKECNQLPMCLGGCKLNIFEGKHKCKQCENIPVEEKIKLHYYNDIKNNNLKEEII